jgi:hypothetical protein
MVMRPTFDILMAKEDGRNSDVIRIGMAECMTLT